MGLLWLFEVGLHVSFQLYLEAITAEQMERGERTGTLLVSPLHRLAYSPLVKVAVVVSSSFAFIWSWVSRVFCSAALL